VLHAGEYFGQESCLLGQLIRTVTVVAVTGTELYTLSSKAAEEIVNNNPELEDELALLGE
jgi:CRP-like cAMP-binding protein